MSRSYKQNINLTKKAEILLIGNELLIGKTRDFNGYWLGKQMSIFGISITRVTIIRDDVEEIAMVMKEITNRDPDYIFTSGGLGPTYDDETIQGIARFLDKKLVLSPKALEWIKERYDAIFRAGRIKDPTINDARKKMAYIPEGTTPLYNSAGAAPGVLIQLGKIKIFVLPGVPREMQAIFQDEIAPILNEENKNVKFFQVSFKVDGVGESTMAKK
ncbi:MAG: competence/damage-inducible protein A, partial [Promethearchaeota archaeon]